MASSDVPSGHRPSLVSFKVGVSPLLRDFSASYCGGAVPPLSEAESKHGKKERLLKRACSSIEGESVRERGTDLQAATVPRMVSSTASEAPAEFAHEGMVGPTLASPLEDFFVGAERDSLVEPDPSFQGFFGLPPLEGTPQVIDLKEARGVPLLREQVTLLTSREAKLLFEAMWLREELEVSRAKVTRLQASLWEGDVRSLAIAEYLHSNIHRRREEFERSHYSQSGYVRALSDVTAL
ncbi:hypothetical protein ACLOJK_007957 [Asimina triloba]